MVYGLLAKDRVIVGYPVRQRRFIFNISNNVGSRRHRGISSAASMKSEWYSRKHVSSGMANNDVSIEQKWRLAS